MNNNERNKKFKKERTQRLRARTRIQRDTYNEIQSILKQAEDQVLLALRNVPTEWQAYMLPQLQQSIKQAMQNVSAEAAVKISAGANEAWQAGIDLIDKPIEAGGVRIAAILPGIETQQLLAMRTFMTDRIKDVGMALANKLNVELGLVAIGAKNQSDALTTIANLLETGGRKRALGIVRTEVGRVYSTAAQARMAQAKEILPGLKKQWRRSGKRQSRIHHDAIDGVIKNVDEKYVLHSKRGPVSLLYPRDPAAPIAEVIHCGCESLPYMETWDVINPGRVA